MLSVIWYAIFWLVTLGVVHSYFLYPATLKVWSLFVTDTGSANTGILPSVTHIIAAYNEEEIIAEKIENSLELEYPDKLIDIIVFSDASSDRTDEIVRQYEEHGVTLRRIEGRVGKTECQNRVAQSADSDILVFSDANSMYEADAITELIKKFDEGVGCVVGELKYRSGDVEGESLYWTYESLIKRLESRVHSLVTGNGAIYAVRSGSYVSLSRDAISDFAEPLAIVRNEETVKYAPGAIAWEETEASASSELRRRIRIVTRSWNTVADNLSLLNPFNDWRFAYEMWSHKVLRWLTPVFLVAILLSNTAIVFTDQGPLYQAALASQLAFYLLAGIGLTAEKAGIQSPTITHIPFYFLYSSYGMLIGFINFLQGENIVVWDTSDRK